MDVSFLVMVVVHSLTPTRSTIMFKQVSSMVKEMWLLCRQMRMSCGSGMRQRSGSSRWRWDWQKRNGNKPVSVFNWLEIEIQCQFGMANQMIIVQFSDKVGLCHARLFFSSQGSLQKSRYSSMVCLIMKNISLEPILSSINPFK